MTKEEILKHADYTQPDWITDTSIFYLAKNGFGHYWPKYAAKATHSDAWCNVVIRDSNPLKTLKGAIRAVEATRARWNKR
jgi:hypothetical protein